METLEALSRKIRTAHDLLSVVKTMKSLAAVNIRHYEGAADAMDEYASVIASGWHGFFYNRPRLPGSRKKTETLCLVLGSDQGMCGRFNEVIIQYALSWIRENPPETGAPHFWSAGERIRGAMEEFQIEEHFSLPSSTAAIADLMVDIVDRLARLQESRTVDKLVIFYNRPGRAGNYEPGMHQVLPLDHGQFDQPPGKKWPTRCFPMLGTESNFLFEALFHQHIFASIYKVFAQSLAGENAARLAAMQAAEKNILKMEEKLQGSFRETRQNSITAELLDIISGFEAIKEAQQPVHESPGFFLRGEEWRPHAL